MPRSIVKLRLHFNKPKIKQELNKIKSTLPANLQSTNKIYYQHLVF